MHFHHGLPQFLNILLAASVWMLCMVEGADAKENQVILRNESYTIAILRKRTKAMEDFMMVNLNLKGGKE